MRIRNSLFGNTPAEAGSGEHRVNAGLQRMRFRVLRLRGVHPNAVHLAQFRICQALK